MAKKSYYVHMRNKYPHAAVQGSDDAVTATYKGETLCAVVKDGLGRWVDGQHEYGARDAWDLSPIPKEARFMKLDKEGRVCRDEKHAEREPKAREWAKAHGKVPSQVELEKMPQAKA